LQSLSGGVERAILTKYRANKEASATTDKLHRRVGALCGSLIKLIGPFVAIPSPFVTLLRGISHLASPASRYESNQPDATPGAVERTAVFARITIFIRSKGTIKVKRVLDYHANIMREEKHSLLSFTVPRELRLFFPRAINLVNSKRNASDKCILAYALKHAHFHRTSCRVRRMYI